MESRLTMIAADDEQAPGIRYGEKVAFVRQAIEVDLVGHADRQIMVGLDQTEPLRSQSQSYRTAGRDWHRKTEDGWCNRTHVHVHLLSFQYPSAWTRGGGLIHAQSPKR